MKNVTIGSESEAADLARRLETSALRTVTALQELEMRKGAAMELLALLKFEPVGCDPLDSNRPLNLIEQLNQTFTYKASFDAAAHLIQVHPQQAPLVLNLGTSPGNDIESKDGRLVAEVFASVDPGNNRKLEKDIERLVPLEAPLKYVFYLSPTSGGRPDSFETRGVRIVRIWP